jgi:hypothetical protein
VTALVSALVGDCDDAGVVDDAIVEDMVDVGDDIELVVRRVELVGSNESLVDGSTLLGAAVVGATLRERSRDRTWTITDKLTRKMHSKTLTLQKLWVETQQRYDVSEPNADVTQVSKVVGVADELVEELQLQG